MFFSFRRGGGGVGVVCTCPYIRVYIGSPSSGINLFDKVIYLRMKSGLKSKVLWTVQVNLDI